MRAGAAAPIVAGLFGQAAETAHRSGFAVLAGGLPECNCPDDCDRDHENE